MTLACGRHAVTARRTTTALGAAPNRLLERNRQWLEPHIAWSL
jgi:hypothetical protein